MNLTDQDLLRVSEDFCYCCERFSIPLYDWQTEAFGGATQRADGTFVYPLGAVSVPRGNGKSWGAAAVGSWRLVFGPPPQDILSVALDLDGAKVVMDHARKILQSHPVLDGLCEFKADSIAIPSTGSTWRVRSRDHTSSRGLHPTVILYDECGWAKDDELFASLLAAQASVRDPLFLVVSTVGRRKSGPLWTIKSLAEGTAA
jgi:phage terminase large subunit-like protein